MIQEWQTSTEEWAIIRRKIARLCPWCTQRSKMATFYRYISKLEEGDTYLEVGTWLGCTAAFAALATPPGVRIVTIDSGHHFREQRKGTMLDYIKLLADNFRSVGLEGQIDFHLGESTEVDWNSPIHVLFLDGSHSYEAVAADIKKWTPFLVPNGIALFDDFSRKPHPGVRQAVDELVSRGGWEFLTEAGHLAVLRKKKVECGAAG